MADRLGQPFRQAGDSTEVEYSDSTVREQAEVARMGICM
jgi:hypothetical protein